MSSHSHVASAAASESTTLSTSGPRLVFAQVMTEVETIARAAEAFGVAVGPNIRSAVLDAASFALLDLIGAIHLEFFRDGELIREHQFAVADDVQAAAGPPPEQPPLASSFPPGTRLRISISRNPRVPRETYDAFVAERGWVAAEILRIPEGTRKEKYGVFSAGGYSVERHLLVSPHADDHNAGSRSSNERY